MTPTAPSAAPAPGDTDTGSACGGGRPTPDKAERWRVLAVECGFADLLDMED